MKIRDECPNSAELAQFQIGALGDTDIDEIGRHLADCIDCQVRLSDFHEVDSLTDGLRRIMDSTIECGLEDDRVIKAIEGWAGRLPFRLFMDAELPRIDGYEVLEFLGRGGMGVVYKARDLKLKRTVALKMVMVGAHAGPRELARFRIEAEAVARLQHPNIVQIYEVGETDGYPYCALEFAEGGNLAKKLDGQPMPALEAAKLVESLARAMHLAHSRNVVHRDLKPANILLTNDGTPKITDFGLARRMDSDSGETQTGAVMGTPSYMAPEQASGLAHEAGPAADVYALGAILYECLAGRPPFKGRTVAETLEQVRTREATAPSRFKTDLPIDLDTICMKCLRKEPESRYSSAAALADELVRYRRGEPILARPVGRLEWGVKWIKRNPLVAGSLAGLAGFFLIAFVLVSWSYVVAQSSLKSARENERAERWGRYRSNIAAASAAFQLQNSDAAREALKDAPAEHRGWEWHYLQSQLDGASLVMPVPGGSIQSIVMSPSGRQIAVSCLKHNEVYLFNMATGEVEAVLKGHSAPTTSLAYRPDGMQLATAANDQTIRLWDPQTGRQVAILRADAASANLDTSLLVAYNSEGSRIASSSGTEVSDRPGRGNVDGAAASRLWDVSTGREIAVLAPWREGNYPASFSPDGKRVAVGFGKHVHLCDAVTGRRLSTLGPHANPVQFTAFSPDGKRIASTQIYREDVVKVASRTSLDDNAIHLWNGESGDKLAELRGHASYVHSVRFSPDGSRLASGSTYPENTARLWNAATGQLIAVLAGHKNTVNELAFSPDGRRIVTSSLDQTARLWDGHTGRLLAVLSGHAGQIRHLQISLDGRYVVTASEDATLRLWHADSGQLISVLRGHSEGFNWQGVAMFNPDCSRLVSGSRDGTARVWDVGLAERNGILHGHESYVYDVAFSNNGLQAATAAWDGTARLWDPTSGIQTGLLKHETRTINSISYSQDGHRLVTGERGRGVNLWENVAISKPLRDPWFVPVNFEEGGRVALNPAGAILAAGSIEGPVRLWDVTTKKEIAQLVGHERASLDTAFHPTGRLLATTGLDGTVRLWDVVTHAPVAVLRGHTELVWRVAFSKDGKLLASGSNDKTIRLWDVQTHEPLYVIPTGSIVYGVAFSPDGSRLAAGCRDNTVRLFDVATRQQVAELHNHDDYVHAVDWSPDGTRLISGSGDFTARIWDSLSVLERARRAGSK